jgi:hypothetical protein
VLGAAAGGVEEGVQQVLSTRCCRSCPSPCCPCLEDVCMLSLEKLPCGEVRMGAAGVMLLPMLLADSVLQARRGVCCRCCPSAVQLGE